MDADRAADLGVLDQTPQLPQDLLELQQLFLLSHVVGVLFEVFFEQHDEVHHRDRDSFRIDIVILDDAAVLNRDSLTSR